MSPTAAPLCSGGGHREADFQTDARFCSDACRAHAWRRASGLRGLDVVAHHVVDRRLIGGRPPRELWRRRVL
jgi:hypothetical protein